MRKMFIHIYYLLFIYFYFMKYYVFPNAILKLKIIYIFLEIFTANVIQMKEFLCVIDYLYVDVFEHVYQILVHVDKY